MEYPKIDTLFERDAGFALTETLRNPVYAEFRRWHVTEKIDGTNIRVMLNAEGRVSFAGRTDASQLHQDLYTYLARTFTPEKMKAAFWSIWSIDDSNSPGDPRRPLAILFGEGYGPGIQRGGIYRRDKAFRLFDVLVDGRWWLRWPDVEDVAAKLGVRTVPFLGWWTLDEIVSKVKAGFVSTCAHEDGGSVPGVLAEGVVGRTLEPLFDCRGNRIILKLKTKDFGK